MPHPLLSSNPKSVSQSPPSKNIAAMAAAKIDSQDHPPSSDPHDKVIATAHHIVKSLATDQSAADDMLRILSSFDHRFSSILNPSPSPSDVTTLAADVDVIADDDDEDDDEVRLEIRARLDEVEMVISRWDSVNSDDSLLFESTPEEISDYLFTVDDVISLAIRAESESYGDLVSKAEILIQIAMSRLEDEFRHLMIRNTVPLDAAGLHSSIRRLSFASDLDEEELENSTEAGESCHLRQESTNLDAIGDDHRNTDLIRPEAVVDLRDIADRMIHASYHKELCQVYSSVRRDILDECLSVLGIDKMSIDEVQRIEWKFLDDKMRKWIQAVRVVVRVLLFGERSLCDHIFSECDEVREECFVESTKGCVMQLLNFGDAIAIQKRSSEKLFRILDMYEALAEVKPSLDELFVEDSGSCVLKEVERILDWLGDAVRGTLAEFESAVQKERSKKAVQGGEIHPLSRYVMNYVKLLVDYSGVLEVLLDGDVVESEDDVDYSEEKTRLGYRLRLLILYLECNLEEKAKLYEDLALQFIFLMNNRLYIVHKIKNSELEKILGENWVRKRRGKIRQYHNSYLRATWTKALSFLKDDGSSGSGHGSGSGSGSGHGSGSGSGSGSWSSKMALKDRFKNFNLAFEDIYKNQTTWKVPDPQLREELRLSTSETIIPAYRSFLGRFGPQLETSRNAAKYIKYTADDLEDSLLDFFEGSACLSNHPKKRISSS